MSKPYKGGINNWAKIQIFEPNEEHLGFIIAGNPVGHPDFKNYIKTSLVVKISEDDSYIETLNSRYDLLNKLPFEIEMCYEDGDEGL